MFGLYRTLLAIAVVYDHAGETRGPGFVAVFGFFCLSGFLMTLLMTGPYAGRPGAFFVNRFLRLYPIYWAVLILTIALWRLFPDFRAILAIPDTVPSFVRQILFIVRDADTPIVRPAWAIANEIVCYGLIGFGISATRLRAVLWFAASLAIVIYVYSTSRATVFDLYFPVIGAFLPFSLGAVLAQFRDVLPKWSPRITQLAAVVCGTIVATLVVCVVPFFARGRYDAAMHYLHLSLLATAPMTLILYHLDVERLRTVDDYIGRFSYPLYLTHTTVFLMVGAGLLHFPSWLGTFGGVLVASAVASFGLILLVDSPIQRLRSSVKSQDWLGTTPCTSSTGRSRSAPI